MKARDKRLKVLKESIKEIDPREAFARQNAGAILIDIREADETAQGSPAKSLKIIRGFLELRIEENIQNLDQEILVMCAGGVRSLFASQNLKDMGYTNVQSVAGGFNSWKHESLPVEIPQILNAKQRARYGRHLLIPEVGEEGQLKLLEGRVLIVGAGGLGSPAAMYLSAAGVGTIGIVDDDVVDQSNLQRQIIHSDDRVGTAKVDSAKETLHSINPDITINTYQQRLTSHNIDNIIKNYDVVIDGTDNFPTRYLVNDACIKHHIPNVHGSIFRFEGQVSVFWPSHDNNHYPCYRCLYSEPPPPELAPSCAEAGVLGVLPGVVGLLEAVETVKLLIGVGDLLLGRLLHYDALKVRFTELKLKKDPNCQYCHPDKKFPGYIDYQNMCQSS